MTSKPTTQLLQLRDQFFSKLFFHIPKSLFLDSMLWRGRGKGSSDLIRRGAAFRAPVSSSYDPFETPLEKLGDRIDDFSENDQNLLNSQRVLVNYLLSPGDDMYMRVPLSSGTMSLLNEVSEVSSSLWKRISSEIGSEFYPTELMTESRSTMLGIVSKKKGEMERKKGNLSLAALEQSEQTGGDNEGGEGSPKSQADIAEEEEDDDSIGAEDYLVHMDYEDEGAKDDDYAEEDMGGGDYGGEF